MVIQSGGVGQAAEATGHLLVLGLGEPDGRRRWVCFLRGDTHMVTLAEPSPQKTGSFFAAFRWW